jgi:RHS repeat-associated protein
MAGIGSQAANTTENKKKYNGIEFDKDLELNIYEADLRDLDAQTGRWWQIDPKVDEMHEWSTYASNFDNPIRYKDPLGDEPDGECCGGLWKALSDAGDKIMLSASGVLWGSLNTATGGLVSTDPFNVRPGLNGVEKMYWDNSVTVGQVASMLPVPGHTASEPVGGVELAPAGGGKGNVRIEPVSPENATPSTKQSTSNQNTGGGRGSNNRKPDPNATGDHSVIDKNGNTTYKQNSKNPTGFDEAKRTDVKGKAHTNTNGSKVETPHVHEKGKKDVRPAVKGQDY